MTTRVRAEMPEAEPRIPRERGWWIGLVGFAVIAALMFAWGWKVSLHPNGFRGRHMTDAEWTFPMDAMIGFAKAIAIELAILAVTFVPRGRFSIGGRSILLGLLMLLFSFFCVLLLMHASAPLGQFFLLQLAGALWLIVFGIVSKGLARLRPVR